MADTSSSSAPETLEYELPSEHQDEDFQPIAQLVTPNPPKWFKEYLHFFHLVCPDELGLGRGACGLAARESTVTEATARPVDSTGRF